MFISRSTPALGLALAWFPLTAAVSHAATVSIGSYTYLNSPSGSYPDSGGELSDGITASAAWSVPATPIGAGDVVNLVGWSNVSPSIRFDFTAPATVGQVTVWAADSDGAAGVALPATITISTPDLSFSRTFTITDPVGSGSTVPLVLNLGAEVPTSSLVVTAGQNSQWTMFSEVEFSTVPEPSAAALALVAAAAGLARRRRA